MVPCTNSSFSLLQVVCIVGVVGCVGEAEVPGGLAQTAAALNELSTVHYESEASISAEGDVLASSTSGSLTRDVWQRVARPWTFLHEDTIYDELAAIEIAADGSRVMRYQVTSRPNLSPATGEDLEQPAEVVERDAILAQPGDELRVSIQVRGFPEWNIPLLPPPELSSTQEFEDAIEEREAAIGVRQALADSAAADLRQAIEGLGGEIVGVRWTTGSVLVSIPRSELDTLTEIPAVRLVTPTGNVIIDGWELGAGRTAARTEVDTFHSYGFRGGGANAARHAFGDITIAQIETAVPEDEACMFYTSNCSGSNRIRGRYECDNASPRECDSNQGDGQNDYDGVANYLPADEQSGGSSHATLVASVLVADYQNGQGDGATLCDDTAPNPVCGPHNATWENNATGMAPHASIVFFGLSAV